MNPSLSSRYSGKGAFIRWRGVILLFAHLFRFLPRALVRWLWCCSDLFEGKLALALRYLCLRRLSAACGDNVFVGRSVTLRYGENLRIGSNVSLHTGCYLDAFGGIDIGNDVSIAHQSSILSLSHGFSDQSLPIRSNPISTSRVVVEDDVWIGCGVRILSGVTIGSRTIVGAGAVVNRSIGGGVFVGVPARLTREIPGRVSLKLGSSPSLS